MPTECLFPISHAQPLLLGSGSPRRRDILVELRIPTVVHAADVDEESRSGESPIGYIERIVEAKLGAVSRLRQQLPELQSSSWILVADTIVVVDEEVLGKPTDERDALRLLQLIAGRTHVVFTRYALAGIGGAPGVELARTVRADVTLKPCSEQELARYAATGEGLDKAGAYAVQGIGSFLVENIAGAYTTVVGLPACELVKDLQKLGAMTDFPYPTA